MPRKSKKALSIFFGKYDFDVIVAVQGYNSILLAAISDNIGAKTIGWQHNSFEAYFRTKGEYFWNQDFLFRKYLTKLNGYIALNKYDADNISKYFHINAEYIYNPKSFQNDYQSDGSKKFFIAAGRFCKAKGFDILVDAFKIFSQDQTDWKIYLVGDGEEKKNIRRKIEENGLSSFFILPGYVDNIQDFFYNSSVLLLPSRWEGMPMIVLESLEMGIPVISFDISAIEPLITNMCEGIIVKKESGASGFARAMRIISDDAELRRKLSLAAKDKAKKFDIERILSQWIKVLNNLMEERK